MAPIISFATKAVTRFATASGPRGHLACKLASQVLSLNKASLPSAAIPVSWGFVPSSFKIRCYCSKPEEKKYQPPITKRVFFDISIGGKPLKPNRIIIGLYGDVVPVAAENFRSLCTGKKGFGYKGSNFHCVVKNKWIKGGDIIKNGCLQGTQWESIYESATVTDEDFTLDHDGPGVVSMQIKGRTYTSKFAISTSKTDSCYEEQVVIGRVLDGMDVVKKIASLKVDDQWKCREDAVISECGEYHIWTWIFHWLWMLRA